MECNNECLAGCCNKCGTCNTHKIETKALKTPTGGGAPLPTISIGMSGRIVRILGKGEIRNHLVSLGFNDGEKISVVNEIDGNMILDIKGSRVAINQTLAMKIFLIPE